VLEDEKGGKDRECIIGGCDGANANQRESLWEPRKVIWGEKEHEREARAFIKPLAEENGVFRQGKDNLD